MLKVFATANALIVREPHTPAADAGTTCTVIGSSSPPALTVN